MNEDYYLLPGLNKIFERLLLIWTTHLHDIATQTLNKYSQYDDTTPKDDNCKSVDFYQIILQFSYTLQKRQEYLDCFEEIVSTKNPTT